MQYFSDYDNTVKYYRVHNKCRYYNIEVEFEIVYITRDTVSFNIIKYDCNRFHSIVYLHRTGKPALLKYKNNRICETSYYKWGKKHRIDGPAMYGTDYYEYYQNGKLHRIGGPAIIHLSNDRIVSEIWYLYGEELS